MPQSSIRSRSRLPRLPLLATIGIAGGAASARAVVPVTGADSASAPASTFTSTPASSPAPLPFKQEEDVMSGAAGVSILLLVVALVAVIWAANRGRVAPRVRRFFGMSQGARKPGSSIDVSGGTPLNAAVKLHTVDWEGGRLLVAANAAGGVTVLQVCPGAAPGASAAAGEATTR